MFVSRVFRIWFFTALLCWLVLFNILNDINFLIEHWYYPAIMVVGAFVAGVTPEGGGAVAFPVLNIFLNIDRTMARDFSLMVQSIGMTSASIYILSHKENSLRTYRLLLVFIPIAFVGFILGMQLLQQIPVYVIQALFLSLITSFALIYSICAHRGNRLQLLAPSITDKMWLVLMVLAGGMCASLFGTGADIILYTLLVTRFRLQEKIATHFSIILMASISVLGFGYRYFYDQTLSTYQIQTWLCAFPVVLLMAPLGAFVLHRISTELMLKGIAVLNIGQLGYFLLVNPSWPKLVWASGFTLTLSLLFYTLLKHLVNQQKNQGQPIAEGIQTPFQKPGSS